jgi:hypothetical protein
MSLLKKPQRDWVLASWAAVDVTSLNIPLIQGKYLVDHFDSLIGKDFKIIVQTAPFVLYQFMNDKQRNMWIALGQLASYIFQTRIHNMQQYLAELRWSINNFLFHVISHSAQWVNKPKFHALKHYPESIERLGSATLFATEKFESFNSILCTALVHSNRLQPGRDLGLNFLNFQALQMLLSNAGLYNHQLNVPFQAFNSVTHLFRDNCLIQKSMGYNLHSMAIDVAFPAPLQLPLPAKEKQTPPKYFNQFLNSNFNQVLALCLSQKDVIKRASFVLVSNFLDESLEFYD